MRPWPFNKKKVHSCQKVIVYDPGEIRRMDSLWSLVPFNVSFSCHHRNVSSHIEISVKLLYDSIYCLKGADGSLVIKEAAP